MRGLVPELDVGGGQVEGLGERVHGDLALGGLVGVEEAGYESGGDEISIRDLDWIRLHRERRRSNS